MLNQHQLIPKTPNPGGFLQKMKAIEFRKFVDRLRSTLRTFSNHIRIQLSAAGLFSNLAQFKCHSDVGIATFALRSRRDNRPRSRGFRHFFCQYHRSRCCHHVSPYRGGSGKSPMGYCSLSGNAGGGVYWVGQRCSCCPMRFSSLVATLATGTVMIGIEYLLTDQQTVYGKLSASFMEIGQGALVFGLNNQIWVAGLFAAGMWVLAEHTEIGRYFYATGSSREAARLSGINVRRVRIYGFNAARFYGWSIRNFNYCTNRIEFPGYRFALSAALFHGRISWNGDVQAGLFQYIWHNSRCNSFRRNPDRTNHASIVYCMDQFDPGWGFNSCSPSQPIWSQMMSESNQIPVVELCGISKSYPGVKAVGLHRPQRLSR